MGQFAMRSVGLAPLVEQRQDLGGLLGEEPMNRRAARRFVGQPADGSSRDPAVGAHLTEGQFIAGLPQRPAGPQGVIDQLQQPGVGGRIDSAWDPTT